MFDFRANLTVLLDALSLHHRCRDRVRDLEIQTTTACVTTTKSATAVLPTCSFFQDFTLFSLSFSYKIEGYGWLRFLHGTFLLFPFFRALKIPLFQNFLFFLSSLDSCRLNFTHISLLPPLQPLSLLLTLTWRIINLFEIHNKSLLKRAQHP